MRAVTTAPGGGNAVQSVDRVSAILHELLLSSAPLTTLQVSRASGINRTTCHRLLRSLCDHHMVSEVPGARYELGPAMLLFGNAFLDRLPVRRVALPYLVDLTNRVIRDRPWIVALAIPVDREGVLVDRIWQTTAPLDSLLDVGTRMPLTGSAHGRVMLSTYPPDEVEELVGAERAAELAAHLDTVRARGHLDFANSEIRAGISAIAAAIPGPTGRAVGSVALSGAGLEDELHDRSALSLQVRRAAQVIAGALPTRGV